MCWGPITECLVALNKRGENSHLLNKTEILLRLFGWLKTWTNFSVNHGLPSEVNGAKSPKTKSTIVEAAMIFPSTLKEKERGGSRGTQPQYLANKVLSRETTGQRIISNMKVKRVKHARKYLTLFKNSFGIFEPYQILGKQIF